MKVKIRFTGNKGNIDEEWLQPGDRFEIEIYDHITGKTRPAGTFEIMEIDNYLQGEETKPEEKLFLK